MPVGSESMGMCPTLPVEILLYILLERPYWYIHWGIILSPKLIVTKRKAVTSLSWYTWHRTAMLIGNTGGQEVDHQPQAPESRIELLANVVSRIGNVDDLQSLGIKPAA